jgi:hypothetical protein
MYGYLRVQIIFQSFAGFSWKKLKIMQGKGFEPQENNASQEI